MDVKPADSNDVWLVTETLPFGSDVDPTLPMEFPEGTIPTNIARSLQVEDGTKQENLGTTGVERPKENEFEEPPPKKEKVEVPEIPEKARCFQKIIKARNFLLKTHGSNMKLLLLSFSSCIYSTSVI